MTEIVYVRCDRCGTVAQRFPAGWLALPAFDWGTLSNQHSCPDCQSLLERTEVVCREVTWDFLQTAGHDEIRLDPRHGPGIEWGDE